MTASKNPMAGYTVLKSAVEQMKERDVLPEALEVMDMHSFQKKPVEVPAKPAKKARNKPAEAQPPQESKLPEPEPAKTPDKEVVFVTPYTEVSVRCFEVYRDKTVFSVVTPSDDRVKVKPQRGAKLSAVYFGEPVELYASGIYIPIESMGATVSVFFVIDSEGEQE